MSWLVCAYFTRNTIYEEYAENFVLSLKKFDLPYEITPIDDFRDWYKGIQYKPIFLKKMLRKYYPHSIIYVDIDVVFCRYPDLFDRLDKNSNVDIAVHVLDHSKYRRKNHLPELLSGTIFLKNSRETSIIINEWIEELAKDSKLWDQKGLENVIRNKNFYHLPEEYCMIFDYMSGVKNPVIKHFQASRVVRRRSESLGKKQKRNRTSNRIPRKVGADGMIRIGRINLPHSIEKKVGG